MIKEPDLIPKMNKDIQSLFIICQRHLKSKNMIAKENCMESV